MSSMFLSKSFFGPCAGKDLEMKDIDSSAKQKLIIDWSTKELAPSAGLLPLPRWVQGPLSVPYKPGTPIYKP
jgi:hypothetical protein